MECRLAIRHIGGYIEVKFPTLQESGPDDLRFSFADGAQPIPFSRVHNYGSIFHDFGVSGKIADRVFMKDYYDLAVIRGQAEGADYVVVQRGLERNIVRSGKKMKLSSTPTLLVNK